MFMAGFVIAAAVAIVVVVWTLKHKATVARDVAKAQAVVDVIEK
jgi:hypothetical protein